MATNHHNVFATMRVLAPSTIDPDWLRRVESIADREQTTLTIDDTLLAIHATDSAIDDTLLSLWSATPPAFYRTITTWHFTGSILPGAFLQYFNEYVRIFPQTARIVVHLDSDAAWPLDWMARNLDLEITWIYRFEHPSPFDTLSVDTWHALRPHVGKRIFLPKSISVSQCIYDLLAEQCVTGVEPPAVEVRSRAYFEAMLQRYLVFMDSLQLTDVPGIYRRTHKQQLQVNSVRNAWIHRSKRILRLQEDTPRPPKIQFAL
jgi:hypothetical protein